MKDIKKLNLTEIEKVNGGADEEAVAMIDDIEALEALGIEVSPDAVPLPSSTSSVNRTNEQIRRLMLRNNNILARRRRVRTTVASRTQRGPLF